MKTVKPKNAKKEFLALLLIGLVVIIVATTCLLVFYRPFVKWKKLNFENDKDGIAVFDYMNMSQSTYYYTIDGVDYCKVLDGVAGAHYSSGEDKGRYILYVNVNDPNDVKRGNLGGPMLGLTIGFIATGGLLVWFGFHQKKSIEKKQGKYTKKWSKRSKGRDFVE